MQDWAWEVADSSDLDEYLTLFAELEGDEDLCFTLADMIIQAFEDITPSLKDDPRWNSFLARLLEQSDIHAYQIWYWASFDIDLEDAWDVAPFMRELANRISSSA